VYTQGRAAEKEEFKATKKGKFEQGRIAVLADEGSASASEIIAGAIQDWDRGVVIGRRTFGKGLVQEQFELEDGSALRLTVSRYYTPVGRSIQRPYPKGKEVYNHDYQDRLTNGSLTRADTSGPRDTTRYYTGEKHRTVFGGGGIYPDIVIPYETILYSKELYTLLNSSILNNNVYDYYAQHSVSLSQFKTFQQFSADFKATSLLMEMLRKRYEREYPEAAKKVWQSPESVSYLRSRTKALLAKMLFHNNGYYMQINLEDKIVQRAKGILNSAEYSIIMKGQGG
jgi:carboxyl-terminal processing protease